MSNVTRPLPRLRPDGFPRRQDLLLMTELEKKHRELIHEIESAGCHPLLTAASVLVGEARDVVADWLEQSE